MFFRNKFKFSVIFILIYVSYSYALEKYNVAPPNPQACTIFKAELEKIILAPLSLKRQKAPTVNPNVPLTGLACYYEIQKSGEVWEGRYPPNPLVSLRSLLINKLGLQGWKTNTDFTRNFEADGIDATIFALQKNKQLIIIKLELIADTSKCPKDQPTDYFSNCSLEPKDRLYKMEIFLANLKI